jgi:hypothetical protein
MTKYKNKLQKVISRIAVIKLEVGFHKDNIALLHHHARNYQEVVERHQSCRKVSFTSIARSEQRYLWTVNNLSMQIVLLERELETLMEYGI